MDYFEQKIQEVVEGSRRAVRRGLEEGVVLEPLPAGARVAGARDQELAVALQLGQDELELLWSVIAFAVEPRVAVNAQRLFGADATVGVTLAQHAAWRELSSERCRDLLAIFDPRHPLRTYGLIAPATTRVCNVQTPWTTAPRVWEHLRGRDELDASVAALGGIVEVHGAIHSPAQQGIVDKLRTWLAAQSATVILDGPAGSGRRTALSLAAAPRRTLAVDFGRVAPREAEAVLVALRREALFADAIPVLANFDELWSKLAPGDEVLLSLSALLDQIAGPIAMTTSTGTVELRSERRTLLRARWPLPDAETRRRLWAAALGEDTPELDVVAHRYELGAGGITFAVRSAGHHAELRKAPSPQLQDLVAGVQDNIAERLGELARRVEVQQDWGALVLPRETLDDIKALISRVRHSHLVLDRWGFRRKLARGTGVAALFSGPPGTGKTMVAGLIARELQLELYQVDLSRIVSKWVGETEKQLAKVFEAAEAGHALLLFDEADSLFAKRSAEVKSATDRYANLEVNYLLQRVESFPGIVVLTTNLDSSLDPALRRRLASHVVFPLPELEERTKLWREMVAAGAPHEQLELEPLAEEFDQMSGAHIRNAVLTAAYLAAEEGKAITTNHLYRAAQSEYRAMGRMLTKGRP